MVNPNTIPSLAKVARKDCYPPEEELVAKCLELGLVMRTPEHNISPPPLTLEPFPIPRDVFETLKERQLLWNIAVDRAARHPRFLKSTLESTGNSDRNFTGRLLKMYENIYLNRCEEKVLEKIKINGEQKTQLTERPFQPIMLGIFRTDYMMSREKGEEKDARNKSHDGTRCKERCAIFHTSTSSSWKNVEINTISVSFAGLSPLVSQFHAYVRAYQRANSGVENSFTFPMESEGTKTFECSHSDVQVPAALGQAFRTWEAHLHPFLGLLKRYVVDFLPQSSKSIDSASTAEISSRTPSCTIPLLLPVVVVVIQEEERNTGDQYKLLLRLLEKEGIVHIRRSLQSLHRGMRLVSVKDILSLYPGSSFDTTNDFNAKGTILTPTASSSNMLPPPFAVIEEKYIASVVYFRSCYTPGDFLNEDCWAAREVLERSNAVKCPSLPYHLMTWKKVQQRFTDVEEVLQGIALGGHREDAEALASHFVGQFALNKDEENLLEPLTQSRDCQSNKSSEKTPITHHICGVKDVEELIQEAIAHPERYVLKPQLEGGGNLFAGENMRELLRSATLENDPIMYYKVRREFILMERIDFPLRNVGFFRQEKLYSAIPMSSELGIFGVILSDGSGAEVTETEPDQDENKGRDGMKSRYSPYLNAYAGYVVRSKPEGEDDGGVMAGLACLDSLAIL